MPALDQASQTANLSANQKIQLNISFWEWFDKHQDDEVTTLGILFIRVTVRVKHLYPLWLVLFGVRLN